MKTWLITGCSSGIGAGIAEAALSADEQVIVSARNVEKIKHFEKDYPDTALSVTLDLTDDASMKNAVRAGIEKFGRIDVLVNNAGYGYRAAVEESEDTAVRQMFETNVFGPGKLMNLVLPQMRAHKDGIIINVSSIGAVRAAVGNGWYSASKAALELVSEAVEKESAHLAIQVMIVEPGAFRTHFYGSLKGTHQKIEDYNASVDAMRLENTNDHHDQPGDPAKAGNLIVKLVQSGKLPKRLPLGRDAVQIIDNVLNERMAELHAVKQYSVQTDFDK